MAEQPWRLDARTASLRLARALSGCPPARSGPRTGRIANRWADCLGRVSSAAASSCRRESACNGPAAVERLRSRRRSGGDLRRLSGACSCARKSIGASASHPTADAIAAVELVVSVQTSLLDSSPRLGDAKHRYCESMRLCAFPAPTDGARADATMRQVRVAISSGLPKRHSATPRWSIRRSLRNQRSNCPRMLARVPTLRPSELNCGTSFSASGWKKGSSCGLACWGSFSIARDDQAAAARHYAAFLCGRAAADDLVARRRDPRGPSA